MRVVGKDNKAKIDGSSTVSKFKNVTLNKELNIYIDTADALLREDSKMMVELKDKSDFKYESGQGDEVGWRLLVGPKEVPVLFYKPFNPWTAAMGYSDGKAIHINSRKFPKMSYADILGLLLHEYSHMCGFNHGTGRTRNYKTEDKCLYSVPYFISENISRWL